MPEARGRLARRIAWEALAWYCASGLFLAAYVGLLGGRQDWVAILRAAED